MKLEQGFTAESLQAGCTKWQEVLRLRDWEVVAELVDGTLSNGRLGSVAYNTNHRTALITIASEVDDTLTNTRVLVPDQEVSLVHELLHLHMAPLDGYLDKDTTGTAEIFLEQAINAQAELLVQLRRTVKSLSAVSDTQATETTRKRAPRRAPPSVV